MSISFDRLSIRFRREWWTWGWWLLAGGHDDSVSIVTPGSGALCILCGTFFLVSTDTYRSSFFSTSSRSDPDEHMSRLRIVMARGCSVVDRRPYAARRGRPLRRAWTARVMATGRRGPPSRVPPVRAMAIHRRVAGANQFPDSPRFFFLPFQASSSTMPFTATVPRFEME